MYEIITKIKRTTFPSHLKLQAHTEDDNGNQNTVGIWTGMRVL